MQLRIKQAFILAAGLGKRMQPVTNTIPKPMIEIKGQSLITRTIDLLKECGIQKIVINSFHKADMLKQHISTHIKQTNPGIKIKVIEEEDLLETGGGIVNALQYMANEPFFVVNSDSLWISSENVFAYLMRLWDSKMHSLFLLQKTEEAVGYDHKGDFDLDQNNMLIRPTEYEKLPYAYAGVHITKPENFAGLKKERCKLMDIYDKHKKKDTYQNIHGVVFNGSWFHVGTEDSIKNTETLLATLYKKTL
jgi:N-acetyl-alpha-D-muramate 1-phosphate uridylyltransferase